MRSSARACLTATRPIEALGTTTGRASAGGAPPQARIPGEDLKMASAAPTEGMPIFYNAVEPINLDQHGKMKVRGITSMPDMGRTHAVPLTVDEFTLVQRHYPIVSGTACV